MKRHIQLNSQEQQQAAQQQQQAPAPLEFESAEAMLRYDALHTPVPPSIGRRLRESLARLPAAPARWWRRLFGRL